MRSAVGHEEIEEQLVTRPDQLAACCEHIASCPRFGFDTEFVGEDSYHPHLCLVQVATPERLILVDPLTAGPLDAFWNLVTDQSKQVIVHAGREEVRLCRLWAGRNPGDLFDLQIAAGLVGLTYPLGHAALVSQVLGVQIPKGETLTEWRDRPLTRAQIRYAFDDVRYLLPSWQKLAGQLDALDRMAWAREEFARLAATAVPEETSVERWRKLRGLGSLDRRRLAAVRELYGWREESAARNNRPARAICRDDLLVEIARRNPTGERDLRVIRGLPRRDFDTILRAVARAQALPLTECPALADRDQDPSQVTWAASMLTAVLGDLSIRRRLAPNLVANNNDIKLLVRSRFQGTAVPAESLLTQGWRAAHILPDLLAVLDGKRSIRIRDVRASAPLVIE
jgi:ribonuclease D